MKSGLSIDPTDILAIVLMAIFAMRKMDIRATEPAAFPHVPAAAFEAWKARAAKAKTVSINACFLKFALNSIWFFGFGRHLRLPVLATGGWLIFLAWIAGLIYGWWLASSAKGLAASLGIVVGRRPTSPEPLTEGTSRDQEEASSR